jgi:hypothetical protein
LSEPASTNHDNQNRQTYPIHRFWHSWKRPVHNYTLTIHHENSNYHIPI